MKQMRMIFLIKTKMIIFEGIPGSGKTTTSQLLNNHLIENGIDSKVFIEGCEHPIDLPFYAYFSISEFKELLLKYTEQTNWFNQNSIIEDEYVLIPYKLPEPYPRNDKLVEYLCSKEFCYSDKAIVSFKKFKKVFCRRFEHHLATSASKDTITIFESVLFQHQIHDINRLYPHINENEVTEYIRVLARIISPLNPVLFYISQNNVKESLERTANIRSNPKWSSLETIEYYIKRKKIEMKAIEYLPFDSFIIDNTDQNWCKMFDTIMNKLSLGSK
jgi:hypothetical protein